MTRVISLVIIFHFIFPQTNKDLTERAREYYNVKNYNAILDLIEPLYAEKRVEVNFFTSNMWSTEDVLKKCYIQSNQVKRGVTYFERLFSNDSEQSRFFEDQFFDLALLDHNVSIAMKIMKVRVEREDFPGWYLAFARIYAIVSDTTKTVEGLETYFKYEYSESKNRVLLLDEFIPYHSVPRFQHIFTEDKNDLEEKLKSRAYRGQELETASENSDAVIDAAAVFKKVTSLDVIESLREELVQADKIVRSNAKFYKNELFNLVKKNKNDAYLRVTLSSLLIKQNDEALNLQIIDEIKGDDFKRFPIQLYWICNQLSSFNKELAKPFLFKMFEIDQASLFDARHYMQSDWSNLLFQTFAKVESVYLDDLLKMAESGNDKALNILILMQEPGLVPILVNLYNKNLDSKYLKLLSDLTLPESHSLLKEIRNSQHINLLDTLINNFSKPSADFLNNYDGIQIQNPEMKQILFNNLKLTNGIDVSFIKKTIFLSSNKKDIPELVQVREQIMNRLSDESIHDYMTISAIITLLRWN